MILPATISSGVSLLRSSPDESSEEDTATTSSLPDPLSSLLARLPLRFFFLALRDRSGLPLLLRLELLLLCRRFFFFLVPGSFW